jgi:phosphomannomutase
MFTARTAETYRCPGEEYDIPRAVHLARLAAFYSKCRNCPHAPNGAASLEAGEHEQMPSSNDDGMRLFTSEGVRGRYLNDLSRVNAAEIAGAMANCLWDGYLSADAIVAGTLRVPSAAHGASHSVSALPAIDAEIAPPTACEGIRVLAPGRPGPCVVLGHDERPSSPDIVTGVGQMLRRMGCRVVDIGLATRPCLMFAIDHLGAAGAVHVSGAGCDPGWTGLDFVMSGGLPCSSPGLLDRIAAAFRQGYSRPSRRPGSQRTFQAAVPYEAGLLKHFHALRPLKIALACPSRIVRDLFARVFRKVACRLIPVETPIRRRSILDPSDPDLARTTRSVRHERADLGVLVDDDGERCVFFDEAGQIVPPQLVARLLMTEPASIEPSPNREAITHLMRDQAINFAADGAGRYWFAERYPTCDALLTLVHLLHALSHSDRPFSEVAR